jgi:dihydrofolate reductase
MTAERQACGPVPVPHRVFSRTHEKGSTVAKIISTLFISLDGVVEPDEEWHFPYFDDAMGAAVSEDYGSADTLLLGRVTYDSFAGAWPGREAAGEEDAAFAKILGDMRKVVVSRRRFDLGWRNVELIDGELVEAARALRDDPSVEGVLIPGSVSVVRQLMAAGLVDELRLLVHPVAARRGQKLFDDGEPGYHLRLVKSEAFPTGVIRLIYAPSEAPGAVRRESRHTPPTDPA